MGASQVKWTAVRKTRSYHPYPQTVKACTVMYDVPPKYRATYQRALAGNSPKAAIKAHCLMCCGWQIREVQQCTAPNCPLFTLRKRYFRRKTGPQRAETASGPRKPYLTRHVHFTRGVRPASRWLRRVGDSREFQQVRWRRGYLIHTWLEVSGLSRCRFAACFWPGGFFSCTG